MTPGLLLLNRSRTSLYSDELGARATRTIRSRFIGLQSEGRSAKENTVTNLHYTRGIMPKRVTSGGAQLRGLAPGQHSSEETSSCGELLAALWPI